MLALWMMVAPLFAGTDEVMAHLRADRMEDALSEAKRSIESSPQDVEAHELLIDILMNLGIGHQAQFAYEQYATDNPNSAMAWYLLGRANVTSDGAEDAYRKAIELDPGEQEVVSATCPIEVDMELFVLTSHSHQLNQRFEVLLDGEIIYSDDDWASPELMVLSDDPISLKAGDELTWRCHYDNTTDQTVYAGLGTADEMCFDFLVVTPAEAQSQCAW